MSKPVFAIALAASAGDGGFEVGAVLCQFPSVSDAAEACYGARGYGGRISAVAASGDRSAQVSSGCHVGAISKSRAQRGCESVRERAHATPQHEDRLSPRKIFSAGGYGWTYVNDGPAPKFDAASFARMHDRRMAKATVVEAIDENENLLFRFENAAEAGADCGLSRAPFRRQSEGERTANRSGERVIPSHCCCAPAKSAARHNHPLCDLPTCELQRLLVAPRRTGKRATTLRDARGVHGAPSSQGGA